MLRNLDSEHFGSLDPVPRTNADPRVRRIMLLLFYGSSVLRFFRPTIALSRTFYFVDLTYEGTVDKVDM